MATDMAAVSVVIPTWNGRRFLEPCLRSLEKQTFGDLQIVLVDNGSVDDSVAFVRETFPHVRVVALPENLGFSAAVNIGVQASTGSYVFVLNNDTELDQGCVEALVRGIEAGPDVAAVGPKVLDFGDRLLLGGVGDGYTFAGLPSSIGFLERDHGQLDQAMDIFSPSGSAALYRREVFDALGGLDEDFFAYFEDVDLGFRIQLAGLRCRYVPEALVYHVGSGSTGGRINVFTLRQMSQNMVNVAVKNLPVPILLAMAPVWLAVQMVIIARTLVLHGGRRRAHLTAYATGLGRALRLFPRMLVKRRRTLRSRQLTDRQLRGKIRDSERMILQSLLRARGQGWPWAPLVRTYLRAAAWSAR